jgi:hypothetical protein
MVSEILQIGDLKYPQFGEFCHAKIDLGLDKDDHKGQFSDAAFEHCDLIRAL